MSKRTLLLGLAAVLAIGAPGADPEKSVVQISAFTQAPVWDAPWRWHPVERSSGSGFVIAGRRILSNAHVVAWARQLMVRRYQDPRPYMARAVCVAHDCDLALLEVADPAFFEGLEPLEFGDLPKVRSTVVTYGYPAGGEQISYTRGVVSRIELQPYVHIGNRAFLAVQTDAAINPGNSGGPVIQDDKVVGVAFMGIPGLENTGFFIPPMLARHVLKDLEDGLYDGFPLAGIRAVPLQNPAYRRYLELPDNDLGARIDFIRPSRSTEPVLHEDDVLLQAGSYWVGSDSAILYQGNRLSAAVVFSEAQHGESIPVTIWRQGREVKLSLPLHNFLDDRNEGNQFVPPKYLIHGGLVFTPLSRDYLETFGPNWADEASAELIYELRYRRQEKPDQWRPEPVVLATTLAHPVNANLSVRARALVDRINGVRIESMADAVRAFDENREESDVIDFITGNLFECLDRAEARRAQAEILRTYSISQDRRL